MARYFLSFFMHSVGAGNDEISSRKSLTEERKGW